MTVFLYNPSFIVGRRWELGSVQAYTADQAISNQKKRNSILNSLKVTSLFSQHKMEDGALVKLDKQTASIHVSQVLNDLKRARHEAS